MPGALFLVSTPIGNLEDITLRALRVLKEVDRIAAEDTRHTRRLLQHFAIRAPILSYHQHSPPERRTWLLEKLLQGESIALVTDAGTPGISDPGWELVRDAAASSIKVIPIPGASALLAGLAASGFPADSFIFEGFLPRRKANRRIVIDRLRTETRSVVIFEAPHRLGRTLQDLAAELGSRPIAIGRELTKLYEEIWRGTLNEALERWQGPVRGEFVLILGANTSETDTISSGKSPADAEPGEFGDASSEDAIKSALAERIAAGMSRRDAARQVAGERRMPYRTVYRQAMKLWPRNAGTVDMDQGTRELEQYVD